jgi:hypothetical protein
MTLTGTQRSVSAAGSAGTPADLRQILTSDLERLESVLVFDPLELLPELLEPLAQPLAGNLSRIDVEIPQDLLEPDSFLVSEVGLLPVTTKALDKLPRGCDEPKYRRHPCRRMHSHCQGNRQGRHAGNHRYSHEPARANPGLPYHPGDVASGPVHVLLLGRQQAVRRLVTRESVFASRPSISQQHSAQYDDRRYRNHDARYRPAQCSATAHDHPICHIRHACLQPLDRQPIS